MARCRLEIDEGGSYVPLHVGAAVGRRDEAEEVSGSLSGRAAEFPGIVEGRNPFGNSQHQIRLVAGGKPNRSRVSSDATAGRTENKA